MTVTAGADMKDLPEGMPRGGGCGMREREGPAPDGGGALRYVVRLRGLSDEHVRCDVVSIKANQFYNGISLQN